MSVRLVETVKLVLTKEERIKLLAAMNLYISTVNSLVREILSGELNPKGLSTIMFEASLPSAIKCQCVRDAKSVVNRYRSEVRKHERKQKNYPDKKIKAPKVPVLKLPVYYVNNQNFKIVGNTIVFPMYANTKTKVKSKRVSFDIVITERQRKLFEENKLGLLRIVMKNGKFVACVQYELPETDMIDGDKIMGIDLGLKCPAVSYDTAGRIRFYGNGRKNRYLRRKFFEQRRKLQRKKKYRTVKRRKDKERCIMKDTNHKISRQIINEAIAQGISAIKLEELKNVRKGTTKKSTRKSRKNGKQSKYGVVVRKNNRFINSWSFGQLRNFIVYKAKKAGIRVVMVNPKDTSKECPVCHTLNKATDRDYRCGCGFHKHRDVVGAMNICCSTKTVGNRQSA